MLARPALGAVAVGDRARGAHATNIPAHEPALHNVEIHGAGVVVERVAEWRRPARPRAFRAPLRLADSFG